MKEIKDYLHLYLGAQYKLTPLLHKKDGRGPNNPIVRYGSFYSIMDKIKNPKYYDFKLILRPLSDMTEEEMIQVIQLTVPDSMEDKPTVGDYDLDLFYNDGGNMVDGDVAIGANYSCICYEGQIAIRECGSVHFFNEDGNPENAYNIPKVYTFLLSKHFDLFGLIEAGIASDKTKI